MDLEEARLIAHDVHGKLEPACERIAIAGSIRREAVEVKDVELVYIPRMIETPADLFSTVPAPMTEKVIADLVHDGYWCFDDQVKRNGPKYKRLIHLASGVVIELFRAQEENWGLQLVLRTGPAHFNQILVNRMGGVMPVDMKMEDGFLWRRGIQLETPTEEAFFAELGLPWLEPEERTAKRLWEFLQERRTSYSDKGTLAEYHDTQPAHPIRKLASRSLSE